MLKKSKISGVKIHSDNWYTSRLGKFTASEIFHLMPNDGMGVGALSYIRRKVGEELTGKSANGEIDVEATRWGDFYESEAINKFGIKMGLDFIICQQLITESHSRFGCTPDGLIVHRESPDQTEYEVEPVEVKCPFTFDNYIALFECDTPQDLRAFSKQYYFQVLDQMDNCDSLTAYFVCYHPDFRAGNMKFIKFDVMQSIERDNKKVFPIYNDLKLLRDRKAQAVEKFEEIRQRLIMVERV